MLDRKFKTVVRYCMIVGFVVLASVSRAAGVAPIEITGPNGKIKVSVNVPEKGWIAFNASLAGKPVFVDSPLGFVIGLGGRKTIEPGKSVTLVKVEKESGDTTYKIFGNHAEARDHYNGVKIYLHDSSANVDFAVEFRVFDDAMAYRYFLPKAEKGFYRIVSELSTWNFVEDCKVWFATKYFEADIREYDLRSVTKDWKVMPPLTAVLPDGAGYVTLMEANVVDYGGSTLSRSGELGLRVHLRSWIGIKKDIKDPVSAWRVAAMARDLNTLVNTDVITNLCPPPPKELANADWIKPGRAVWSWWSSNTVNPKRQKEYADMASELGFEYNLIDWHWDQWPDHWKTLADIVDYSKKKGVGVWVWWHSKKMRDPEFRKKFMDNAVKAGVVGLKVDFFPPENQVTMEYYETLMKETAEHKLMINFHGCGLPNGRSRTWPNNITREAVMGHELWMPGRFKMDTQHNVALPFTRYIVGHGDYTPTSFDPKYLKRYSWGQELAEAIVFLSPVTHYAGDPKILLANPAVDVLKKIPTVWDETIVLPGSKIGEVAGFARRSGTTWFVGVMNNDRERDFKVDLGFLGSGEYKAVILKDVVDGKAESAAAWDREDRAVKNNDVIDFKMRPMGGFVAMFSK